MMFGYSLIGLDDYTAIDLSRDIEEVAWIGFCSVLVILFYRLIARVIDTCHKETMAKIEAGVKEAEPE